MTRQAYNQGLHAVSKEVDYMTFLSDLILGTKKG